MNGPKVAVGKRGLLYGELSKGLHHVLGEKLGYQWPLKSDLCSPATHVSAHMHTQMLQLHPWTSLRVSSPQSLAGVWRHICSSQRGAGSKEQDEWTEVMHEAPQPTGL